MELLVVGCGLTGAVIAREMAEKGKNVLLLERRDHVGGNMYDFKDEHGYLVQKYGPHIFHTTEKSLFEYVKKFEEWNEFNLCCGACWDKTYTTTPFNFSTIDKFYPPEKAKRLKEKLQANFEGRKTASVVEVLSHPDGEIRAYAEFLFENDYAPYTAKQWGVSPKDIDPSVLSRVPLRFSYEEGYFDDPYQAMPKHSFTTFFENLLNHPNIDVKLGIDATEHLTIHQGKIYYDADCLEIPVIYTGPLDELFGCVYGRLPYRSLRFEWHYSEQDSIQPAPVVAYPKEDAFTRITEYKKLPVQEGRGSTFAVEYPIPYQEGQKMEPYYPVLTNESQMQYEQYYMLASRVKNLIPCGRLADFKYYNMDQALKRALQVCEMIQE